MSRNDGDNGLALDSQNAGYVERVYEDYLRDASSVPLLWQRFFRQNANANGGILFPARASFSPRSVFNPRVSSSSVRRQQKSAMLLQHRVDRLVVAYRVHGHLAAKLDPLALAPRDHSSLIPENYGLTATDLDCEVFSTFGGSASRMEPLRKLIERLSETYCNYIGFEYMHIPDRQMREWIQQRIERANGDMPPSREVQLRILTRLTDAVIFEEFVRKKYLGAKTFSLEGAETLIPLLEIALESAAREGIVEVVMAMAHRGRLNVLANIVGKQPVEIFREFEDPYSESHRGGGDVKYHLGASGDWQAATGASVHVSLCFNPSHLEYVNPVALGRIRAKQDRLGDHTRRRVMAVLIHGDAAFAGEGVTQESLNLTGLKGYSTGGALHVIVNNQLGFTTSPIEGRSTTYASDIAKMLPVPIFHVNGECPQAVARVVKLAMDFRSEFQRDVVIDMYGYRRWGHNEADEPSFTQPLVYQAINHRPSIRDSYLKHLLELGNITQVEADSIADTEREELEQQFVEAKEVRTKSQPLKSSPVWDAYFGGSEPEDEPETGVPIAELQSLLERIATIPVGFHVHKKLQRSIERRRQMAKGEMSLDWSAAEALAFASLAVEGHMVRLAGQDTARGTFSQRHAVLHDVVDGRQYEIFQHLAPGQAPVEVINSPLCESATMGFEYGYSLDFPDGLVLWEAQYGDFVNAAQVIVDQFIASAEDKWRRLSGLVLLLPHAFEGKGPEHSSARVERFLLLAAEDNLQVVCPTTPAQYFHCLRRQVMHNWRKPMIVLTPKSLLRHPGVTSSLSELASGRFRRLLSDTRADPAETSFLLLASGKMYYDLIAARDKQRRFDVAILRIEQFYPLTDSALSAELKRYPVATHVRWVQEEPENMGAWPYWKNRFGNRLVDRNPFSAVARPFSASPATGSAAAHHREQDKIISRAFEKSL